MQPLQYDNANTLTNIALDPTPRLILYNNEWYWFTGMDLMKFSTTKVPLLPGALDNRNIVVFGNSYCVGNRQDVNQANWSTPFPDIIAQKLSLPVKNYGVSGQSTTQILNDIAAQAQASFIQGKRNIALFVEGHNDLLTVQAWKAVANIQLCARILIDMGYEFYMPLLIHMNRINYVDGYTTSSYNYDIDETNVRILGDLFWTKVIRPDLEPMFAAYDAGGYAPDGIHPNDLGQQKYADLFMEAIS